MMNKSAIALAVSILAISTAYSPARAADLEAGRAAFETCRGCHSIPAYSNVYPTYYVPKVGGQRAEYVVSALKAYREQNRSHRTMKANAHDMTDQTIENIAAYLEASPGDYTKSPANGDAVAGKKLAQSCLGCHVEGKNAANNIPRLAGQYGNYLVKAMQDYQSGKRNNPVMQSMVNGLSEEELENIAAYFAGLKGLTTTE
ncbi:MAG: hypothetical protein Kow0065_08350 [Methylomicrobium sp.]